MRTLLSAALVLGLSAAPAYADDLDCAALANSADAEPAGYAEACGPFDVDASTPTPSSPTSTGFTLDIRGDAGAGRAQNTLYSFVLNNFAGQTPVAVTNPSVFALDFDPTGTTLYAIPSSTAAANPNTLGTINTATGAFTPIAVMNGALTTAPTGLTIDPVSGTAYISSTTDLFTIDLTTATTTAVGTMGTAGGLVIDIAMDCNGALYAHDIGDDSLYSVNTATGAATVIGGTGLAANFAQGMDFDNDDGQLYGFVYTGGGTNTFGTFNLATGAVSALSTNSPLGEFEGAIPTTCVPPDSDVSISKTANVTGPLQVGSAVTFTLTVSNAGPGAATDVVVTDALPSNVTYVSDTCAASVVGSTVTWTVGALANGATAACDVSTTVSGIGQITNTASATTRLRRTMRAASCSAVWRFRCPR